MECFAEFVKTEKQTELTNFEKKVATANKKAELTMTQSQAQALRVGAYRFIGRNSIGAAANDVFAHVSELVGAALAVAKLREWFQQQQQLQQQEQQQQLQQPQRRKYELDREADGYLLTLLLRVADGSLGEDEALNCVSHIANTNSTSSANTMNTGASFSSTSLQSPLISFVAKLKADLDAERGCYKRFLDTMSDFDCNRISPIRAAVSVFELLHHHSRLLDAFCIHILPGAELPAVFAIPAEVHMANFKPPKHHSKSRLASHSGVESNSDTSYMCKPKLVANILPVFHPNGIHAVPLSSAVRPIAAQKKTKQTKRTAATAKPNNIGTFGSAVNSQNPPLRPSRNHSSVSEPSTISAESLCNVADPTPTEAIPRRTTRSSSSAATSFPSDLAKSAAELPAGTVKSPTLIPTLIPPQQLRAADKRKSSVTSVPKGSPVQPMLSESSASTSSLLTTSSFVTKYPSIDFKPTSFSSAFKKSANTSNYASIKYRSPTAPSAELRKSLAQQSSGKQPHVQPETYFDHRNFSQSSRSFIIQAQPSTSLSTDPALTKESRKTLQYIMNAMLHHQSASPFCDDASDDEDDDDGLEQQANTTSRQKTVPASIPLLTTANIATIVASSPTSTITDCDDNEEDATATASTCSLTVAANEPLTSPPPHHPSTSTGPGFNLSRMADRLDRNEYKSHLQFRRDFDGILSATRAAANTNVPAIKRKVACAEKLERYFMNEWTYFFPEMSGKRRRTAVGNLAGVDSGDGGAERKKGKL
ncbi:hypothetical protein HK100_008623 [Physocladia obscura]|uniref:Uncharacterized protein n=1 Tax=Physocladia obscura TaxID=109957 RepID=A0AAD5SNA4_9FUNG|nr:hypothetical protein HK100_008623 [Physocladia obscura]